MNKLKNSLLGFLILISVTVAHSETINGRVVAITDGDTIKVLNANNEEFKIRLAGIDAPEKKQAFGQVSKQTLSDLIFDKMVVVEWHKKDRYERIVGKVLIQGRDANLNQIKSGVAWFYRKYESELTPDDRVKYDAAESDAKAKRAGLWIDKDAIPPWDYRKQRKAKKD